MNFKLSAIAAAIAAATLATGASAASIDFHGYARAGIGASDKGGSMVCFKNVGSIGNYRLGNECDTYFELELHSTLAEKGGSAFKLHTMMAGGTQQLNDWEQNTPAWRNMWVEATNAVAGGSLWVGKRYYKRNDIHMLDFFYDQVTGYGAGLENADVGFAKFSYALMRQGGDMDWSSNGTSPRPNYSSGGNLAYTNHDFRLEGIGLGDFGTIDGRLNFIMKSARADENGVKVKAKSGWGTSWQHTIGVLGGFNRFVLQYAKDNANLDGSVNAWWNQSDTWKYTGIRVLDHLVFDFGDINGSAVIGYQKDKDFNAQKTFTIGVRPWYHINDLYAVGTELGYVSTTPDGGQTRKLSKITLAGQMSAGKGYWARPALRAYYTYANWNDAAKGAVACIGRDCGVSAYGYGNKTSGSTIGAQFEAWW